MVNDGLFDSLQSKHGLDPHQQLLLSSDQETEQLKRKKKSSKSFVTDGFKFLSKELYSVREQLNKEANELYKGKVLIDRRRTRDILSTKFSHKAKIKVKRRNYRGSCNSADPLDFPESGSTK